MTFQIESLIGQATQQSLIIDAYDTSGDDAFLLECLGARLHVFGEVLEAQSLLLLTALIDVPDGQTVPFEALMAFNADIDASDLVYAGYDAENRRIVVRRSLTLRDVTSGEVMSAVEVLAHKTGLLRSFLRLEESAPESASANATPEPEPEPYLDTGSIVFRG